MTVNFDYYTPLRSAFQLAKYELATLVNSTTSAGYYASYSTDPITNPSDTLFFYSYINPGHSGTTSAIEYYFYVRWYTNSGASETLAYKWQIKASGGSWADIVTGSITTTEYETSIDVGVYDTAVVLPAEVRLIGTDADANWAIDTIDETYMCAVRCIGTV